jgi:hypothetical protein
MAVFIIIAPNSGFWIPDSFCYSWCVFGIVINSFCCNLDVSVAMDHEEILLISSNESCSLSIAHDAVGNQHEDTTCRFSSKLLHLMQENGITELKLTEKYGHLVRNSLNPVKTQLLSDVALFGMILLLL